MHEREKRWGESVGLFHIVWQIPAWVAVVMRIGRFRRGVLLLELVDYFSGQAGDAFPGQELIPVDHAEDRENIKSYFFE